MASRSLAEQPRRAASLRRYMLRNRPEILLVPAIFVLIVAVWELLVKLLAVPIYILPPPTEIWRAFRDGLGSGSLVEHTWVTLQEVLLGFAVGSVAGLVVGVIVTRFRLVERTVYPYVVAFQTVPKVALAPLIVTWFGFGMTSKVVTTALIAFFPLLVNVIAGLQSVDQDRIDLLRSVNASEWQIFRMVRFPSALPFIFAGLDVAIVFSVIGAIVSEFVGARAGLGYLIQVNNYNLNVSGTFAVLVVLSVMGLTLHLVVQWVNRRVVFWQRDDRGSVVGA
ncbi:ABC transporter permease [Sphaerobacter thermophilus]|uniref:ABC transporter permease n=1 Tax=Sphaerobacter thermophilus TaxID=2057 RepID=UPI000DB55E66|nr:MAG: ABC transporter permease [Sphaerobacter thermophilus]